ncbi:sialidase family protein [Schlesneria paludicola]|uniref:sialidase family protein n=1 Tax=Schlesneria paludicola TaxID=360056 RepID=UPI00031C08FD|nr:sialidase family protein [Schlesneria paludicola]
MIYRVFNASLCMALLVATSSVRAELTIEKVFGPDIPGGEYKHPASIGELANGDLYIAYYGGEGEYKGDTAVFGSRREKGKTSWSLPTTIADTPDRADGNGVIWQEPGGATWLFYVCRYGKTWADSVIKYKYSHDNGHTWTDSEMLTFERGMMVRSQPIQLFDGDFLVPIYQEKGTDAKAIGAQSSSLFARYHKKTKEWSFTNKVHSRIGNIQPSVVQLDQNKLIAFCRRGGIYGPLLDGFIVRTESRDGGKTWALGEDTSFPNPNSAVDLIKLKNGHLVMIYNNSNQAKRNPLTMRVSTDQGQTWPAARDIVNTPDDEQGYPFIIQTADGRINGVYTSQKRTVVNHFVLDESDIK